MKPKVLDKMKILNDLTQNCLNHHDLNSKLIPEKTKQSLINYDLWWIDRIKSGIYDLDFEKIELPRYNIDEIFKVWNSDNPEMFFDNIKNKKKVKEILERD